MNYEKLMAKSKFFLKIQYVRYGTVVTMPIVTLVPCLLSQSYHSFGTSVSKGFGTSVSTVMEQL